MQEPWSKLLTETDKKVLENGNWESEGVRQAGKVGANPAVIVVDVQKLMAGPKKPVGEVAKESKLMCGNNAWDAVEEISKLLSVARKADIPIYYFKADTDEIEIEGEEIIDDIKPRNDDEVMKKTSTSGFYSTNIAHRLNQDGIDTLVMTGGSTSGCVRAAIDDAYMDGYNIIVPPECVFDRIELSHNAHLLDIHMKRGNVMRREEVEDYLLEV